MLKLTNLKTNVEIEIDLDGWYQWERSKTLTEELGADWETVEHMLASCTEAEAERGTFYRTISGPLVFFSGLELVLPLIARVGERTIIECY